MTKSVSNRKSSKRNRKKEALLQEQDFKQTHNNQEKRRNRQIAPLVAKNENQRKALEAFTKRQLVVLTGSAGVGKTMLACHHACKLWLSGQIDNIIITRPYKHLGADYGSTKGNDSEKLLPFCMSILMKLKQFLGSHTLRCNFKLEGFGNLFAEADGIQIVPVEKIQGMSFNERTIIIADEVQSATIAQVKALTTRAEEGCQIIVCGDPLQTAIGKDNGLTFLERVLQSHPTEYAEVIRFTKADVVRGGLAAHLVAAFEEQGSW